MSIIEVIRERRSIRKYKADKIKEEDILQIIEAARLAPSGSNTQPWKFIIVKDEATKKKIVEADHKQEWMLQAPVFIVCVSDIRTRIEDVDSEGFLEDSPKPELKLVIRDAAIAISYMLLEAQHLKLGTCWCEFPYKSRVMGTSEPLKTLKAPYMVRNPVKWGFFRLKRLEIPLKI